MDQEKLNELIKENKWLLRQLTGLNNEVRDLKEKIKKLEQRDSYYPNQAELERMPLHEGSDPN